MILETRFVIPPDVGVDDDHLDERWAEVDHGYYVSDYGRVWSSRSNKFLKPKRLDNHGHVGICMNNGGKRTYKYLHRLIAEEFIPNPNNYPIVRHLDDDPKYNVVDNLAWGTQQVNMHDCIENGRSYTITDEDREKGFEKIRVPIIAQKLGSNEKIGYKSINDAARDLGLWAANIQKVLYGERKHTGGYYFERE